MRKKLLNYNNFIVLLYLFITLITIHFHELWFDEAQSWLIARDLSFVGIFKQMAYEGHSCLYFYFLKVLIMIGLPFRYSGYISIFLGLIVVILLVYKSPFNKLINTLLVLSPTFIYYCPVFARPYIFSLLFFILICILYKDRYKHSFIFGIILFLFINSHILAIIFAGSLMLIEVYEFFFKKKEYLKERLIMGGLASLGVLFFAIQLIGSFGKRNDILGDFKFSFASIMNSIINISEGLFLDNAFMFILLFVLMYFLFKRYKTNKKILFIFIFNTVCYILFSLVYPLLTSKVVYIFTYIVFCVWLLYEEDKQECNKLFVWFLLLSCANSMKIISYDIFKDYSPSVIVTDYLLKDKRDNVKVLTLGHETEIVAFINNDRYVFIEFFSGEEYTYCNYHLNFSNVNSDLKEYIIDNDIDYVLTSYDSAIKKEEIGAMLDEGFINYELRVNTYASGSFVIYKVN